jgi:endonuclease/exonuclease/phosphatase family metal-dependent hydrolase
VATVNDVLTVASWNVREGVPVAGAGQTAVATDEIVGLLREHRVDIVGLQEVDFDKHASSAVLAAIISGTELFHTASHILSASSFDPAKYSGVAIASRYALGDARSRTFANPRIAAQQGSDYIYMHDKGLVSAPLRLNGRSLTITSLHAFPFHIFHRQAEDPEFSAVWQDISLKLADVMTGSQIVCGDFNTARRDLLLRTRQTSLRRAIVQDPTYMGEAVDDILFGWDFKSTSVRIVPNFSDHNFCVTRLCWRRLQ